MGGTVNVEISGYPEDVQYNEFIAFFNSYGPPGFRFVKVPRLCPPSSSSPPPPALR